MLKPDTVPFAPVDVCQLVGSVPPKEFELKFMYFTAVRLFQDAGREPVNWLLLRSMLSKLLPKPPHSAGMEPETLRPELKEASLANLVHFLAFDVY